MRGKVAAIFICSQFNVILKNSFLKNVGIISKQTK